MKKRTAAWLLALSLLLSACGGGRASSMKLARTEGTVGVSDERGQDIQVREALKLYSGYGVDTQAVSYAWIDLDQVKLAKLDADSEIQIQSDGKALEIVLDHGSIFFHVTEPLAEDETMTIRTSNMAVGIRGTCGWVSAEAVYILEGSVTVTDGQRTVTVSAGEMADSALTVSPFSSGDIPGFVRDELEEAQWQAFIQALPPDGRDRAALLREMCYRGDVDACRMTPEQAAAFAQVIEEETAGGSVSGCIFDTGNAYPAMLLAVGADLSLEAYTQGSGRVSVWRYVDGAAEPIDLQKAGAAYSVTIYPGSHMRLASFEVADLTLFFKFGSGGLQAEEDVSFYRPYIDGVEVDEETFAEQWNAWELTDPAPDSDHQLASAAQTDTGELFMLENLSAGILDALRAYALLPEDGPAFTV